MTTNDIIVLLIAIHFLIGFIMLFIFVEFELDNLLLKNINYTNIPILSAFLWEIEFIYFIYLLIKIILLKTIKTIEVMNFKILGKAMRFMFLPTLGVLLMLLVGFCDPIAMWEWIKSNSGWAIFVRTALFIIECVLVGIMYDYYMKQEKVVSEIKQAMDGVISGEEESIYYSSEIRNHFSAGSNGRYVKIKTSDPNIIIIKNTK